ncbi:hypothetical protein HY375_00295 [Candidatus Berkelbacteria bacterium]|nr:hypothetical protein [Candidatus Berkelbacteria bacterium]
MSPARSLLLTLLTIVLLGWSLWSYLDRHAPTLSWWKPTTVWQSLAASRTWLATDLPHQGAGSGTGITAERTVPGFFLSGPYAPVLAGWYRLEIDGTSPTSERVLHVQLTSDQGETILRKLDVNGSALPLVTELDLPTLADLEIRLAATSATPVTIEAITLRRIEFSQRRLRDDLIAQLQRWFTQPS